MTYYLRSHPGISGLQVWEIAGDEATNIGVPNAKLVPGAHLKANPGETIWEYIRRTTDWLSTGQFYECHLRPGEYYPRMARPSLGYQDPPGSNPGIQNEFDTVAIARSQLTVLTRQLSRICQTVHPVEKTFETFGHDIRNLLILSCTEAEAHWRGVLKANGVSKGRFTTADYALLRPAMKLDEYAVTFPAYPWLDPVQPYKGWGTSGKPTKELRWYDAYNAVKHDRETEFQRANLRNIFEAVSACVIMIVAQFGPLTGAYNVAEPLSFFHLSSYPSWSPTERYIPSYDGTERIPVNFSF